MLKRIKFTANHLLFSKKHYFINNIQYVKYQGNVLLKFQIYGHAFVSLLYVCSIEDRFSFKFELNNIGLKVRTTILIVQPYHMFDLTHVKSAN